MMLALHPTGGRPRGEGWAVCATQRPRIERWLGEGVRLTKIRERLARQGVVLAYPMLYRFAVEELGFGRSPPRSRSLMASPARSCKWIRAGWAYVPRPWPILSKHI